MFNQYELLYMYRCGDEFAFEMILRQMMPVIRNAVREALRKNILLQIYSEDMYEEGVFSLVTAVDTYREDRDASFRTYASVLIHNGISGVCKYQCRKKRASGSTMISLDSAVTEHSETADLVASKDKLSDPVFVLHMHEAGRRYEEAVASLTRREKEVLESWTSERDNRSSMDALGITRKAYETRKYRVRKKVIQKVLDEK